MLGSKFIESAAILNQAQLQQLASGRRIVNSCMFLGLASGAFDFVKTPIAIPFFIGLLAVAIFGTQRLAKGFSFSGSKVALLAIGAAIPLVGVLIMSSLGIRAAKVLQSSGYVVGMCMFVSTKSLIPHSSKLPMATNELER